MAKGRKTAALAALGLGAAALSGMLGKKDKKEEDKSKDTTADASAGMSKDRLGAAGLDRGSKDTTGDMSAGMSKDKLENMKTPIRKAPVRRRPAFNVADAEDQEGGQRLKGISDAMAQRESGPFRKGGKVKKMAKGGSVRGDGIAQRGKTRGRFV